MAKFLLKEILGNGIMAKFLLKEMTVTNNYDYIGDLNVVGKRYPSCSFTLDVFPHDGIDEDMAKMLKSMPECRVINITTEDYPEWVTQFKDEFKQFLVSKYPEKILADHVEFNKLFGETK